MSAIVVSPRPSPTRPASSHRPPLTSSKPAHDRPQLAGGPDPDAAARAARLRDARSVSSRTGGNRFGEPQARGPVRASRGDSRSAFPARNAGLNTGEKADHPILFQHFFKSVGPRTYAVQVKKATNGNHYIVFTEGRRDDKTDDVRKTRINIFSEDFDAFFDLLRQAAQFVKANPLPPEFVAKRKKLWAAIAKKKAKGGGKPPPGRGLPARDADDRPVNAAPTPGGRHSPETLTGQPEVSSVPTPAETDRRRLARGPGNGRSRQEPPATPPRPRAARALPTARAVAGS